MKWIVTAFTVFGAFGVASPASAKVSYSGTISYKRSFVIATDGTGACRDGGNGAPNESESESWQIHFKHLRATPGKVWGFVRVPITGSFSESLDCPNDPDGGHYSVLLNHAGTVRMSWSIYKGHISLAVADGPGLKGILTSTFWGVATSTPASDSPDFLGRSSQPDPPGSGRSVTVRAKTGKTTVRKYVVNWSGVYGSQDPMDKQYPNPGEPGTLVESVKAIRT